MRGVDFTFDSDMAIDGGNWILKAMNDDPRIKPVIIFLKVSLQ